MSKKLMMGITTALMIGTLAASTTTCSAAFNFNFNRYSESTSTTSETDEDGNITETTVIERTENGVKTEATIVEWTDAETGLKYLMNVPVIITNNADVDLQDLYIAPSEADTWGEDLFRDDYFLAPGEDGEGITLSVAESECKFDIKFIDADGKDYVFSNIDLSDISREKVTFCFENGEDGDYVLSHTTI